MPCSQDQCDKRARWIPVLLLRRRPSDTPARVKFRRLGYCDDHRASSTVETFLSDEAHARLAKHLRESGHPEPVRKHASLAWEKVTQADLGRLQRRQDRTLSPPRDPDEGIAF